LGNTQIDRHTHTHRQRLVILQSLDSIFDK
jgi:hypothetical protein